MTGRKTVRLQWMRLAAVWLVFGVVAEGQLVDSLDAYPPRWSLWKSDCDARVTEHRNDSDTAAENAACEAMTLLAGNGTEALLIYPIEPVRPIDELTAQVSIKSVHRGLRVGFRVRFPYLIDSETRRPVEVVIFGASVTRVGDYQRIGVGAISDELRLKTIALRNQFGSQADVSSPYVDAVVINAYGGPGSSTIRIDDLEVNAMIPITSSTPEHASARVAPVDPEQRSLEQFAASIRGESETPPMTDHPVFPPGMVLKILQHNGEPLAWVKTLGFDAIWVTRPLDAALLNEAIRTRMLIYAAPPITPSSDLETLLEPVMAWVIGTDMAMDEPNLDAITATVTRVRNFPLRWRRPLVGTAVENDRQYAAMVDAMVLDAPPRIRNVTSEEMLTSLRRRIDQCGNVPHGVAVMGMPASSAVAQTDAIAARLGTPQTSVFRWHAMWRQITDALATAPSALLIRSTRSLTLGGPLEQNRALAISHCNRFVAGLAPWIAAATPDPVPLRVDPLYSGHRLRAGAMSLMLFTSAMIKGDETLAGDGKSLRILIPPSESAKSVWRVTHFGVQRMPMQNTPQGGEVEIVSPDVVEVLAMSDQIRDGSQLTQSLSRFARQASLDRWQLASEHLTQTQSNWQQAHATRIVNRAPPRDLLEVAASTLAESERGVRGGDSLTTLRMAARVDAWCLKCDWMLTEALATQPNTLLSSPPMVANNVETHLAWWPLLMTPSDKRVHLGPFENGMKSHWGANLLAGGGLDREGNLTDDGWTFGRRHYTWAESDADWIDRGAFSGDGALRLVVTPKKDDAMPGGYEGTTMLVRSPPIRVPKNIPLRIDAMIRTVGFSGAHQGVLMYDSIASQDLGILVRGRPDWTQVSLIRQSSDDAALQVMFEVIGGGEAIVDEVSVRAWTPP